MAGNGNKKVPTKKGKKQEEEKKNVPNPPSQSNTSQIRQYCLNFEIPPSSQRLELPSIIGRPCATEIDKLRAKKSSSRQAILSNYSASYSLGFLSIFMNLFSGLQSWEVLDFLNGQVQIFIEILFLMLEDPFPVMEQDQIMSIDFDKTLQCEHLPKSFGYGLKKLKEKHKLEDSNVPLKLKQIHIKSLYMVQLLLTSVGEIDPQVIAQGQYQSNTSYFHRIVTHLLDRNSLLAPKVFYQIQKNWKMIMTMIMDQIQVDQSQSSNQPRTQQPTQSSTLPQLNDEMRRQMLRAPQKKQKVSEKKKREQTESEISEQDQIVESSMELEADYQSEEKLEQARSKHLRQKDYYYRIVNSDKKQSKQDSYENEEAIIEEVKQKRCFKDQQRVHNHHSDKKMENNPASQRAYKWCNYRKKYTIQNRKQKRIQKQQARKEGSIKGKKSQTKSQTKLKSIHSQQQQQKPSKFQMTDEKDVQYDFWLPHCQQEIFNAMLIQSFEESYEPVKTCIEEKVQSQDKCLQEQMEQLEMESEGTKKEEKRKGNPNREVKHQNREIDTMIDSLLENRLVIAQSIANYIYHSLRRLNVGLDDEETEKKEDCRRNLSKKFEKKR